MIIDISPLEVWKDRAVLTEDKLLLRVVSDDLFSQAVFYYELRTVGDDVVTNGNITMAGTDYTTWNANPDATPAAFAWAADQLNLTLL